MDIVLLLAALAFLISAFWSAITKAWPQTLLAAGLFLLTLNMSGIIT